MLPIALLLAGGSVGVAAVGAVSASKRDAPFAAQRAIWSIGSPAYLAAVAAEKKAADEKSEADYAKARILARNVANAFGGSSGDSSGYVAEDDIGMPLSPSGSTAKPLTKAQATEAVIKGTIKFASSKASSAYLQSYGVPPFIADKLGDKAAEVQGYVIDKLQQGAEAVGGAIQDGAKAASCKLIGWGC